MFYVCLYVCYITYGLIVIEVLFLKQVINCWDGFVSSDGTISQKVMPDFVHMSALGYEKAFQPVFEALQGLLKEEQVIAANQD